MSVSSSVLFHSQSNEKNWSGRNCSSDHTCKTIQAQSFNQVEVDLFELLCKVLDHNLFAQVDWARNSYYFKELKVRQKVPYRYWIIPILWWLVGLWVSNARSGSLKIIEGWKLSHIIIDCTISRDQKITWMEIRFFWWWSNLLECLPCSFAV